MSNETAIGSLQEKIDDLNQQAWEVRVTDLPKSFELSQESVKLARSIDYPKGLAEGLRSLGFSYVRYSKNDEAAPLLKESLSLYQSLNDLKGQAVVYEYLGIIERNWGNLGASLDLLLKANKLVLQIDSQEIEITCSYQLGVTYKHLGDHENALDYLYKTLSLAKKMNFTLMEAYATNIIGSIYFDNGNYNQALDCYQQGLPIRQQSHDKWGEAGSLDNIGFTYLKLNDLDKAIEYCKQSLAICQGTGDKKGEANALLHLGEIYEKVGDIKQAAGFSNESLEIRKNRGDKRGETEVLLFLADLYKNRNDVEDHQIFEWISGALKIADEIKAQDLLSKAYYNLHEYYQRKGDFKESLVQLEAHFQIEKELHKNSINQKVANLEISHKAEVVSQRNKELTELNEKIEKANEELKIERSLERVRTAAMAMKEPSDMLEVCKIISDQLDILHVKKIRNVQTAIFYEEKKVYTNYEYYARHDKLLITEVDYNNHPVAEKFANQMLKGPNEVFTHGFTGKEIRDWLDYQKTTNVFIDTYLESADSLNYYWYSLGPVALGMSTYEPLNENEIDLFKRFRNVFELAYRRYLDIEKARAQARESQVQLALERVRARTMAMQRSDELPGAATILFQQVQSLGMPAFAAGYCIWDEDKQAITLWMSSEGILQPPFKAPTTEDELFIEMRKGHEEGKSFHVVEMGGKKLVAHYQYMRTLPVVGEIFDSIIEAGHPLPTFQIMHHAYFSKGFLLFITYEPVPDAHDIFKRFGKVFEQTYTRFLDLQKAEAQTKEAKIEAALERVRARTMGMQKSDELADVVGLMYKQFEELDFGFYQVLVSIYDIKNNVIEWWSRGFGDVELPQRNILPIIDHPFSNDLLDKWKNGLESYQHILEGEMKKSWDEHLFTQTDLKHFPQEIKDKMRSFDHVFLTDVFMKYGSLQAAGNAPLPGDKEKILKRFTKALDHAYTRMMDLQNAEAQTREAQIEAALERVRSKTMAMQRSEELDSVIKSVYSELKHLDVSFDRCFIMIFDEQKGATWWMGSPEDDLFHEGFYVQFHTHPPHLAYLKGWEERQQKWEYLLGGQIKKDWDEFIFNKTELSKLPPIAIQYMKSFGSAHLAASFENFGCMTTGGQGRLSEESFSILSRFAKVFDQTYTRFNDLKQAEAQAREGKIEAALERVRSRSMAMYKSDELREVVAVLFAQLQHIGFDIKFCTIALIDKINSTVEFWLSGFSQEILPESYHVPNLDHPFYQNFQNTFRQGTPYKVFELSGEEKRSYDKLWFTITDFKNLPEPVKKPMMEMERVVLSCAFTKNGMIQIGGIEPLSNTDASIIQRFAKVFEQTHTRFLDLQKAEAQSREAQIELGLERVRAKAMAMRKSDELKELIGTVYTELTKLDLTLDRCFIMIFDNRSMGVTWWMSNPEAPLQPIGLFVKYHEQPPYQAFIKGWKERSLKWQYVLEGEVKKTWDKFLFVETELSQLPDFVIANMRANEKVYLSASFNNFGCLTLATLESLSDEHFDIMLRFAKVFDLTYTRFNDLKQAEAQTREAKIEAALERVRARALAMQEPEELKDVAQVLRSEMGELGVEELETCSIYINDEATNKTECWYALKDSREEGKKLVSDHFPLNLIDTWVGREMKNFYGSEAKQVSIVMQGADRKEWINYCEERSVPLHGYYGEVIPDRTYHLYKFSHGAIGAAAAGDISAESWKLLSRAASVFSLAYSRFKDLTQARNDLIQLKEEKKRAEEALTELQATQKQLIQAEKMASLGELTAGIAHEIQNPLNFVNNFSDVSNELLEEMKQELATGNTQQAIEIAGDVKENLEKILHHGKRADAIVKGMLQHSRTSSGQKELTDINVLADEYLRLAYHGLRAKDKFFNAKFETHLDPSITKINIVPQEIGRVILNLINNSFYAVSEKKNAPPPPEGGILYEPVVTVTTKRLGSPSGDGGRIEIRVADNGNGIPKKALDKIFQPFFTTKPTGQGTGLGLSLSYDIVTKGHDGEIKVETKEGEGSAFTISLPMK